jgi:hypothetical protein
MGGVTPMANAIPMSQASPGWLAQLAPPHAPPAPGWWPLAPGWWMLLLVLLVVTAAVIYRQTRPALRLRRAALRELKQLQQTTEDDIALAGAVELLMRRYAVAHFGRDAVAGLSGERWLAFVVERGGDAWAGESGNSLLKISYGGSVTATHREAWLAGAEAFIRRQK